MYQTEICAAFLMIMSGIFTLCCVYAAISTRIDEKKRAKKIEAEKEYQKYIASLEEVHTEHKEFKVPTI